MFLKIFSRISSLTTDKFCKDKHLLHLGKKYFAYPPQSLVKEIGLYETGERDNQIEYVLLVYMATEKEPRIDIKKIDHKRFVPLQETLFKIKGNGDDLKNKIEKAAKSLNGKYLKYDGESVEFTHRYVKKAVLLSYQDAANVCPYKIYQLLKENQVWVLYPS
jgi:hypothetical protein